MECYRSITKCYGSVACRYRCYGMLQFYRALQDIAGRYGSIADCHRTLQNVMEALQGYRVLWSVKEHITECCRTLWNVMEALRIITEHYGGVTEALPNITEPLWKISILPITN